MNFKTALDEFSICAPTQPQIALTIWKKLKRIT